MLVCVIRGKLAASACAGCPPSGLSRRGDMRASAIVHGRHVLARQASLLSLKIADRPAKRAPLQALRWPAAQPTPGRTAHVGSPTDGIGSGPIRVHRDRNAEPASASNAVNSVRYCSYIIMAFCSGLTPAGWRARIQRSACSNSAGYFPRLLRSSFPGGFLRAREARCRSTVCTGSCVRVQRDRCSRSACSHEVRPLRFVLTTMQ